MITIAKKTLSEMVVGKLKEYILERSMEPGDRLPTEQELAELFGVSRTSIREATKALSFLGIINSAPKQGLTVAHLDIDRAMEYMSFHFALNNYPKEQILRTRFGIEIGALAESMRNISKDPALFEEIDRINEELKSAKTVEEFIRGDLSFHKALLEASKIEPLIAFNEILQIFFKRFREEVSHGQWQEGIKQHSQIVRALKEKDLETAEKLLRKHFEYYLIFFGDYNDESE
jgi:GntR family transcriptional repressor for pyruvate dehydrogenase complex